MPTIHDVLTDLVAMPTVSQDTAENQKALDYIQSFLSERGMRCQRFVNDGYGSLVATTLPTKNPRVMLVGHIDVVPASPAMFTLREQAGRLIGRGVLDMKSAIAGYMMTVNKLRDRLEDYDFGIMVTSDEETRDLGVRHLISEGYYPSEAAVLFDGARDWQIEAIAKGATYLVLTIDGQTGHGSRPWLVDSPSIRLVAMLGEIEKLFDQSPESNTFNINSLEAGQIGVACNQIPAKARVGLDIRALNQGEHQRLTNIIKQLCQKYGATYELFAYFPALQHNMNDPHMRAFADSIEKTTGVKNNRGAISYGASDAGHFLARNISCVVTWPTGGGHHSEEEWIDTQALQDITPTILDYISTMATIKPNAVVEESSKIH